MFSFVESVLVRKPGWKYATSISASSHIRNKKRGMAGPELWGFELHRPGHKHGPGKITWTPKERWSGATVLQTSCKTWIKASTKMQNKNPHKADLLWGFFGFVLFFSVVCVYVILPTWFPGSQRRLVALPTFGLCDPSRTVAGAFAVGVRACLKCRSMNAGQWLNLSPHSQDSASKPAVSILSLPLRLSHSPDNREFHYTLH